jgi:ribose transport system permease protein
MSQTALSQPQKRSRSLLSVLGSIGPVYYVLVLLFLFSAWSQPTFTSSRSLTNILVSSTPLAIVIIGQTATMLVAGIDLSVGAVISLTTAIAALLMESHPDAAVPVALLCLGVGLLIGLINGIGAAYLNLNPLILTLGTSTAVQGVALYILSSPGGLVTRGFREISRGTVSGVPYAAFILAALFIVGTYVLRRTPYGLSVLAVGGNEASARLSGLHTRRIKLSVYVLSGLFAALGGLYLASRIGSGDPTIGDPITTDSLSAAVLGGTSLFGGVGSLWGGLAGAFILGILGTMLNLNNVNQFYQFIIKGLILIGALAINYLQTRGKQS